MMEPEKEKAPYSRQDIPKEVPFMPKPDLPKTEPEPEAPKPVIPAEAVHPESTPKRIIDLRTVSFEVDPMVAHKIQMQMQDCGNADSTYSCPENPRFAQTIHTNITKLFYDYIIYKVRMRENLNLAIKGEFDSTAQYHWADKHQTRSGKSTVALSFGSFISSLTRVPYTAYHVCANESEYYSKVKNAKFSELYHIDEQKESKDKSEFADSSDIFGSGSFREEMSIMDRSEGLLPDPINTEHYC